MILENFKPLTLSFCDRCGTKICSATVAKHETNVISLTTVESYHCISTTVQQLWQHTLLYCDSCKQNVLSHCCTVSCHSNIGFLSCKVMIADMIHPKSIIQLIFQQSVFYCTYFAYVRYFKSAQFTPTLCGNLNSNQSVLLATRASKTSVCDYKTSYFIHKISVDRTC